LFTLYVSCFAATCRSTRRTSTTSTSCSSTALSALTVQRGGARSRSTSRINTK